MLEIIFQQVLGFFLQLCFGIALGSFFYNFLSRVYLKGRQWSTNMPDMLKEDKVTSLIHLLTGAVLLITTIIINVFLKPLVGFYLVSFLLLIMGLSLFFPPKGRKISQNCYVMPYHKDHFIVTLNDHKIYIRGEYRRGNPDQIIYKEGSPKWLPPHENEPVSEKDYEFILQAVLKFLAKIKKEGVIKQIP